MHKTRYNSLLLDLTISPRSPLLIKSGEISADPSLPDMQFVRTYRAGTGEVLYIPGASLKGVVRSFIEKALRTLDDRQSWRWACNPFETGCGQILGREAKEPPSWEVYRRSCGVCRLFGHTRLRGRVAFADFHPKGEVKTEIRYGVAISRLSHAVAQGPFEMEVAVGGAFKGRVMLENYELWQLGLVAMALEVMNQGFLKVGFGKNRGFGEVEVKVGQAQVEEVAPLPNQGTLRGLAAFVMEDEKAKYGLDAREALSDLPAPVKLENLGFYLRRTYDQEGWRAISQKAFEVL